MYFNVFMLYEHISHDNVPDLVIRYVSYGHEIDIRHSHPMQSTLTMLPIAMVDVAASLMVHVLAGTHIQPFIP